jgi:molybdate transport system substrate-binding protein
VKNLLRLVCVVVVALCLTAQFGAAEVKNEITVSAAISLKDAFQEIGKKYTGKTGVNVVFNFGASGDLARQIEGGAPVDVFASAAQKDMNSADSKGFIVKDTRKNFARNALSLIGPKSAAIRVKNFEALTSDSVKRIAVGNPKTVPAGRYAAEAFAYYGIAPKIKDKLVYAENVRQVLDYVARGEVDAGVVYSTDAAIRMRDIYIAANAPEASHKPIVYPIAVVKDANNISAAGAFVRLVLSKEGMAILGKYGFVRP